MSDEFAKAVEEAKMLQQPPDDPDMLSLYGLYQQATVGDANTDNPGSPDILEQMKLDAWLPYTGYSKDEAKAEYVNLVEKLKANAALQ